MAQLAVAAVMFAGAVQQGLSAKTLKYEEARGLREAATRRFAAATHEAREEERAKEFMHSRALAAAAAQGTATGSVGVVNLLSDLAAEGEWRMMARLWVGRTEAEGLEYQADQAMRAGEAALEAAVIGGATQAAGAYFGMGSRAGGGGKTAAKAGGFGKATTQYQIPTGKKLGTGGGFTIPSPGKVK